MHSILQRLILISVALTVMLPPTTNAGFLDFFKPKAAAGGTSAPPATASLSGLSQDQMVAGVKEALGHGVQQAVGSLGRKDGFLTNLNVRIPMPASLQKVEKTLRTLRQDKLADDFVATLNRAAERAVPEAASVLGDSVKQMSIADARAILTGTNNAATQYFRRTSETNLFARFHPIVQQATEEAGVTRAYKQMMNRAGFAGGIGSALLGRDTTDLDGYVTRKALDGLFIVIAEEEKRIRENPVARTTDLLKKVFGAAQQ